MNYKTIIYCIIITSILYRYIFYVKRRTKEYISYMLTVMPKFQSYWNNLNSSEKDLYFIKLCIVKFFELPFFDFCDILIRLKRKIKKNRKS